MCAAYFNGLKHPRKYISLTTQIYLIDHVVMVERNPCSKCCKFNFKCAILLLIVFIQTVSLGKVVQDNLTYRNSLQEEFKIVHRVMLECVQEYGIHGFLKDGVTVLEVLTYIFRLNVREKLLLLSLAIDLFVWAFRVILRLGGNSGLDRKSPLFTNRYSVAR